MPGKWFSKFKAAVGMDSVQQNLFYVGCRLELLKVRRLSWRLYYSWQAVNLGCCLVSDVPLPIPFI